MQAASDLESIYSLITGGLWSSKQEAVTDLVVSHPSMLSFVLQLS